MVSVNETAAATPIVFQDDGHPRFLHFTGGQVSTGTVFGNEPNLTLDLIHLIQPQDVGMIEGSHDVNLIQELRQLAGLYTGGGYSLAGVLSGKPNGTLALLAPKALAVGEG